jgi:hypothetical protein
VAEPVGEIPSFDGRFKLGKSTHGGFSIAVMLVNPIRKTIINLTRNGWYNPFPSCVFEFCIGFTI